MTERFRIHRMAPLETCQVFMYGVLVGYCDSRPGFPLCFLAGRQGKLTDSEKADVLEYVQAEGGAVKPTRQTQKAFDELARRRADACSVGSEDTHR